MDAIAIGFDLVGPVAHRCCALLLSAALTLVAGEPGASPDWPCWRGPNGNSTTTSAAALVDGWSAGGMAPAWTVRFPGTPAKNDRDQFAGAGSPVVAGGKVYLQSFVVVDGQGRLRVACHDGVDGRLVWEQTFPNQETGWLSSGTACVDQGRYFLFSSPNGILCLDAASGARIWDVGAWAGPSVGGYGRHSTLQAALGRLVCGGTVLDATTGAVLRGKDFAVNTWTVLGHLDGRVVAFSDREGRDVESGAVRLSGYRGHAAYADGWLATVDEHDKAEGGGKFGKALRVYQVQANQAVLRHTVPVYGEISTPICDGRRAWVCGMADGDVEKRLAPHAARYRTGVFCVDCASGEVVWHRPELALDGRGAGIVVDGRLLGLARSKGDDREGGVVMLDAATGAILGPVSGEPGTAGVTHAYLASPAFWNGRLYARGGSMKSKKAILEGMHLICYDLRKDRP